MYIKLDYIYLLRDYLISMFVIVTNPSRIKIFSTIRYQIIIIIKANVYKIIDDLKYGLPTKWIRINGRDIRTTKNIMLTIIFFIFFVSVKSNLAPQEQLFGIIPLI